ncbi:hypothetical protein, partial [Rubrivirga sp.]|uniref:hypothetical protein n=1 Tax=Rubrivirga sp. TaxID=1885344 RepID=UPI003C746314
VFHEPTNVAGSVDTADGFLRAVDRATRRTVRPQEAVRAVCAVLSRRLPPDTWRALEADLPAGVAALLAVPPHPD